MPFCTRAAPGKECSIKFQTSVSCIVRSVFKILKVLRQEVVESYLLGSRLLASVVRSSKRDHPCPQEVILTCVRVLDNQNCWLLLPPLLLLSLAWRCMVVFAALEGLEELEVPRAEGVLAFSLPG